MKKLIVVMTLIIFLQACETEKNTANAYDSSHKVWFLNSDSWENVVAYIDRDESTKKEAIHDVDDWWYVELDRALYDSSLSITFSNGTESNGFAIIDHKDYIYTSMNQGHVYDSKFKTINDTNHTDYNDVWSTVYFINSEGFNFVNAYAWDETGELLGEWPGVSTDYEGNYVHSIEIPVDINEDSFEIIFTDGDNQTGDISMNDSKYLYVTYHDEVYRSESTAKKTLEIQEIVAEDFLEIYFKNTEQWPLINVYLFNDEGEEPLGQWPGTALVHDEDDWWTTQLNASSLQEEYSVVFSSYDGRQTNDIPIGHDDYLYFTADGSWYSSKEDLE